MTPTDIAAIVFLMPWTLFAGLVTWVTISIRRKMVKKQW